MRNLLTRPIAHVGLLIAVTAGSVFPNLGVPSLWDDDEGVNAECTREMMEAGTWIVPTFNWDLRTAKPILLYWLMRGSYSAFGVSEWSARLPSAVMMFGIVLLTYDLGRRMFGAATGLLAGLITASTLGLVYLAHAVTTDSTLICLTTLYFWAFWRGTENGGRSWFIPCGIASGLAMLAKGPAVGLVLPSAVAISYFAVHRELHRMIDRRMIWGVLAWILVAVPWYVFVATETKGEWPRAFFLKENVGRAAEPMENHSGIPVLYELLVVCLLNAPWSSFLVVTWWSAWQSRVNRAVGYLAIWFTVYFLACSAARTKLPHYIAPAYPALIILTARFLVGWMHRYISPPRWALPAGILGVATTGIVVVAGLLYADGRIVTVPAQMRVFPGLANWAWIGLIPLAGACLMTVAWWNDRRPELIAGLTATTLLFAAFLSAFPPLVVDRRKAVKELVELSGARQLDRDVRVASFAFTRPSLTFYVGRRVERFHDPAAVAEFLAFPIESYLFVPEPAWESQVKPHVRSTHRVIARRYDFDRHCDVIVVINR